MIKAVLFDMDGVLVDTEWFYNRRRVAFMEEKGFHFAGIADVLDYTISGHECSAFKPDPEIYLRAMEALGVEPTECLVIEDSPMGLEAGNRSGARVLAVSPALRACSIALPRWAAFISTSRSVCSRSTSPWRSYAGTA